MGIEEFGKAKIEWFCTFLDLPNGIPSHDTFGRVFARLDAEQFQRGFLNWVQAVHQVTKGQVIALDGKTLRRSRDRTLGKKAIHMVSVWASANRLVLGQVKVDEKSNEITALPELLSCWLSKGVKGNGLHNFAVLRHIALNLLGQEKTASVASRTSDSKPVGVKTICSKSWLDKMRLPYPPDT